MPSRPTEAVIEAAVAALSARGDDALVKADHEGHPDWNQAVAWTERAKALVLHERDPETLRSLLPDLADGLGHLLERAGLSSGSAAASVIGAFLEALPEVRAGMAEDVEAAFEGDPAAKTFGEILVSYPSIAAIAIHRMAHVLFELGVPQLPRIMSEYAHARTGIDIHPGARIGRRFFIDHGTGVVIGESSRIGDNVRLYHGVTLGAFSPRRGQTIRGTKRHPTLEDDVTIYPGATILGGETVVGHGSVVNANAYVTESVPPNSRVVPEAPRQEVRQRGTGGEKQLNWEI